VDNLEVSIYIKTKLVGNPKGKGTAVAIVEYIGKDNVHTRTYSIRMQEETRNALNLKICIQAMRQLRKPCTVVIYIDGEYLKSTHERELVKRWQQNDWKKQNNQPPANLEDWKHFYYLTEIHKVQFLHYQDKYETELKAELEVKK
jgi:Ribonuclease HI